MKLIDLKLVEPENISDRKFDDMLDAAEEMRDVLAPILDKYQNPNIFFGALTIFFASAIAQSVETDKIDIVADLYGSSLTENIKMSWKHIND